jgi:catechol 2,3-dioxygenase-like lactoylglutathione lyase family enzyme
VSRQLHDLEAELGVELFERLPRGLRLNATGRAYQADVTRIIEMLAAASVRARRIAAGEAGLLKLGYLEITAWQGPVPAALQDHVAYTYNDLGELLATYRRLKVAGILPHWPINHGVTTSMYYRDPDNNRIELQIDNFAAPEELQAYFQSAAFAEHPVGVTYDPEQLIRDYEAGAPMADLSRIPPLPEGKTPWDMLSRH